MIKTTMEAGVWVDGLKVRGYALLPPDARIEQQRMTPEQFSVRILYPAYLAACAHAGVEAPPFVVEVNQ